MTRKRLFYLLFLCIIGAFSIVVYYYPRVTNAKSHGSIPGSILIEDQESASLIGRSVAIANSAEGFITSMILVEDSRLINQVEFIQKMKDSGTNIDTYALLGTDVDSEIWLVTCSGLFVPRRLPAGVDAKTYTKIDIYLVASDGRVLGIKMHD